MSCAEKKDADAQQPGTHRQGGKRADGLLRYPLDGVYILKLLLHIFILFQLLIEPGVAASNGSVESLNQMLEATSNIDQLSGRWICCNKSESVCDCRVTVGESP